MRIKGKSFSGPRSKIVVIPRDEGNIVFKAQAVLDFEEFEKLFPMPLPPVITYPGKPPVPEFENPEYIKKLNDHSNKRLDYMVIKALEVTEDLEWDTVVMTNPDTWGGWRTELTEAGFSAVEVNAILSAVMDASGLNQEKIDEATQSFLAGLAAQPEA